MLRARLATLALILLCVACARSRVVEEPAPAPALLDTVQAFDLAPPALDAAPLSLWATYYFLPQVRTVTRGHALLDMEGNALGPVLSLRDWCEAALEGSVVVTDDGGVRVYNYAGTGPREQVPCRTVFRRYPAIGKSRFRIATGPYGDGVRDYILVPYRTWAVDPRTIPYGTVLYVPDARGTVVALPDGREVTHDGYFFAADTGGAIKNAHIDVYIGPETDNPLAFVGNRSTARFDTWIVADPALADALNRLHHVSP